jgi:hypothetical protein
MNFSQIDRKVDTAIGPHYPRVLLVNGAPIGQKSGIGALLVNLFRGWPQDRLAQIVPKGSDPDLSLCHNSFMFDGLYSATSGNPSGNITVKLKRKVASLRGYRLSLELQQWIGEYSPHVIYSYLEHPMITHMVTQLSRHLAVPAIPDLRDEWHLLPEGGSLAALWWFIRQEIDFRKIVKNAPFGMTTSDAMSLEYTKRYNRRFLTFMSCADPSIYIPRQQSAPSSKLRLIYTGAGPGLGRWPIIINLAKAVQDLHRSGSDIELVAFVRREFYGDLPATGAGFVVSDFVDERTLADHLGVSDIAVLPEGFDSKSMKYARLSFSSKLPIYLMSGCCIMAIGPMQNNSIKYVSDNQLGVVLQDPSVQVLRAQLLDLYERRSHVASFHTRNREFALAHHSQPVVHEQLRILLNSVRK